MSHVRTAARLPVPLACKAANVERCKAGLVLLDERDTLALMLEVQR